MRLALLAALAVTWPLSAALHAVLHTARRIESTIHSAARRLERE